MSEPRREPATGCYYCGRSTVGVRVCSRCRDIYETDPLGASAREPLSERELLGDVPAADAGDDQWEEAR